MDLKPIYQVLPLSIRNRIQSLPRTILSGLEEVRIRQDRPLEVIAAGKTWFVSSNQQLKLDPRDSVLPTREECHKLLNLISNHSLYALEEELRLGYITVEGGHRIGLAGKVVTEGGKVRHVRDVTAFNIRIARQIKGVGKALLSSIVDQDRIKNLLIVSPPGCGKTTLLRDLARLVSIGEGCSARKVGIVDERSEIAGCVAGVPQHDIGPRTDVLDACPKAEGMMMLIRSMSPEVLVVDEIGRREDADAIHEAIYAGVHLFTTAHGSSIQEVRKRPILRELIEEEVFERIVVLSRRSGPGTIEAVYDGKCQLIRSTTCLS
ncbi:stage III sporulation protein AA [Shimazuella sp. AN120528]|uniref:stage III sporulation protein AA n=1 Tax=Shimazuella soli TaxID=1892854 RepID=UPI001F0F568E|nr:stage III sporulation protein AA [Shimazuella soli]MCH5584177.1 stage III sporulation protein AA [Shimazuella soli]